MRLIKTRPRFHCDFCKHTATEEAMKRHEKICWLNPNRYCESCNNTGIYKDDWYEEEPCFFCKQLDYEILVRAKFGSDYQ